MGKKLSAVLHVIIILIASLLCLYFIVYLCQHGQYFASWLEYDKTAGNHDFLFSIIRIFAEMLFYALIDIYFIFSFVKLLRKGKE